MSFPRYGSYRDSGVEWLGQVPSHWSLQRLDHHFEERREKVSDTEYPPLSVTKNGVVPQLETAAKTDDGDNRKKVVAGDFVINGRSDRKGSSGLAGIDGSVSLINIVLKPRQTIRGRFAHYLLRSTAFQEEFYRFGKGIVADLWSTNFSEMRNILLAVPPLAEQNSVAGFLDCETAKIDILVREQQHLIDLLKEKQQAVISHAVTKGLDPSAPMKDSGVKWLGEVPAHWDVRSLKTLIKAGSSISYGIVQPGEPQEEGVPFIQTTNMSSGRFHIDELQKTTPQIAACYPRSTIIGGEVLLGIRASIGAAHVAPAFLRGANLSRGIARIHCSSLIMAEFLVLYFRSFATDTYWQVSKQGSTFNEVSIETVKEIKIPVPPRQEQQEIIAFLSAASQRSELLTAEAKAAMMLLQEHRTALISEAVTGKIDVRGLAPAQAEAA